MTMSNSAVALPNAFSDLAPFSDWVLPTERERYNKRVASTMDELQTFYDAAFGRFEEVAEYLEQCPMESLSEPDTNLLWMYCSLVTVSFPVEVWRQPRVPDSGAAAFDAIFEPAI